MMVPKSSFTGGFYDVDQSQTPESEPPLLILPVLLGTITVAIPPDHQRLSITTSPGPKHQVESSPPASKFSCKTRNQLIQLWSLPKKKTPQSSHPMKKSKLPNFPSRICSNEKTHHENQGLFGLLWIVTGEARIKFFSTLQVMESSALPPGTIYPHPSLCYELPGSRVRPGEDPRKDGHV